MADSARRLSSYFAPALLESRATVHLTVRMAVRLTQLLGTTGAATAGAGRLRLALPVFVALDLAIFAYLRQHPEKLGLAWRLPLDVLDIAFWSFSPLPPSGRYEAAVLIATPLSLEAGFRLGWRGLVVPAAIFAVIPPLRLLAGRPAYPALVGWSVLAVSMGVMLWRYCRGLDSHAARELGQVATAERRRAFLAGQNAIAMGASSVVDAIEGLVPILGRPRPGSAFYRLADGWKASLSRETATGAAYLSVALLEWQQAHNRHPDLASLVELHLPEGQGTTLLVGSEVGALRRALDALAPRGRVDVAVEGPAGRRLPGSPLRLRIGDTTITVPADPLAAPRPIDPAPVTYVLLGVLTPVAMLPSGGSIPLPAIVLQVGTCLFAGQWSHRQVRARGEAARPLLFAGAAAVALALAVITSIGIREPSTADGGPVLGFGNSVILLAFLAGAYHASLDRIRWAFPAAAALSIAVGTLLVPAPFDTRSVLAAALWCLTPYPPSRGVSVAMARAAEEHARAVLEDRRLALRREYQRGEESVVSLVRQARDDASRQLALLGPTLDGPLRSAATSRLEEVDRRLASISSPGAPLSSTTTA